MQQLLDKLLSYIAQTCDYSRSWNFIKFCLYWIFFFYYKTFVQSWLQDGDFSLPKNPHPSQESKHGICIDGRAFTDLATWMDDFGIMTYWCKTYANPSWYQNEWTAHFSFLVYCRLCFVFTPVLNLWLFQDINNEWQLKLKILNTLPDKKSDAPRRSGWK